MLRQILNKLKGKHSRELDDAEYMRIIKAGESDCLAALLQSIGEKLPQDINRAPENSNIIPNSYELIIECKDESQQQCFFEKLKAEGYMVRVLNL